MKQFLALLVLACSLGLAAAAWATPEYAETTGQGCEICHRDPQGGGPLNATGERYLAAGRLWPLPEAGKSVGARPSARLLRMSLGFIHLAAAVIWFGTIFYVHIVLRPKYALGGLPRAELQVAWVAMLLLAVTGVPLTYLRFRGFGLLAGTYSGRLLLLKIGLFLFLVASAAFVTLFIGPRLRRTKTGWQENDGREGRPVWVRVDQQIYDLTQSARWKEGSHFRRHRAGQDLTDALTGAPHGREKLEGFPSFPPEPEASGNSPIARVFYTMAYLNLFVALGVLLVISAWRWG